MKKLFTFFALSAIVLSMASCGDGNAPEANKVPEGAISGKFTVGEGKQVYFSKGNLRATYNENKWKWLFAEHQWNYIGYGAANNAIKNNGTIQFKDTVDLFGWSTDATNYGINNSKIPNTYYGGFKDWGNTIGDGWYTLSNDEWHYLLFERNDAAHLFGMGNVNNINGVILLPDDWAGEKFTDTDNGLVQGSSAYQSADQINNFDFHILDTDTWSSMEEKGAVFLPAADYRWAVEMQGLGQYARYWTSTKVNEDEAYYIAFNFSYLKTDEVTTRAWGHSVRLVHNAE